MLVPQYIRCVTRGAIHAVDPCRTPDLILRLSLFGASVFAGGLAAHASSLAVTYNPGAVVAGQSQFTADTLNERTYERLDITGGNNFTVSGYAQVNNVSLGGNTFNPAGNRTGYSLYLVFNGSGTMSAPNFNGSSTGTFSTLSYNLYEAAGSSSFGINSQNQQFVNGPPATAVATGSLLNGTDSFSGNPLGFTTNLNLTFTQVFSGFVVSPQTPLQLQFLQNSDSSVLSVVNNGTTLVVNGGGANMIANGVPVAPTPEPSSLALLGTGLAAVASTFRRRKRS